MTHAASRHRDLDRRAAQAMGEPPGQAVVASRHRARDQRTMATPQSEVLLATLTECTSGRGITAQGLQKQVRAGAMLPDLR